jgi:hypothetical protein
MNVRLLRIEGPPEQPLTGAETVRVEVEIDDQPRWYDIRVRPKIHSGLDIGLLVPGEALESTFRHEQSALHRILRLVGQELRGRRVSLPQYIAA